MTCYRKTQGEIRGLYKAAVSICMPQITPVRERVNSQKRNTRDHRQIFPKYLNKNIYESQRHYDDEEDGCAGNYNYNGGKRKKDGAQQHEHSSWQSLVYHVDVLGEAVDNASYRCGVKERLGRVKFVEEQIMVQFPGSTDVPHG